MSNPPADRFSAEVHRTISNLYELVEARGLEDRESVHRLFRSIHSVKSEAASRGYSVFARSANRLESHLAKLRDGELEPERGNPKAVLESLAELLELIGSADEAGGDGEVGMPNDDELGRDSAVPSDPEATTQWGKGRAGVTPNFELDDHARALVEEAHRRGERLWQLTCRVEEVEEMLYPRLYLAISNLEQSANVIATMPPLERLPATVREFHVLLSAAGSGAFQQALNIDGISDVRINEVSPELLTESMPVGHEQALTLDEELSIGAAQVEELRIYADELQYQLAELNRHLDRTKEGSEAAAPPSSVGVGTRSEEIRARFDLADKLSKTLVHELSRHSQVDLTTLLARVANTAESDAIAQSKRVRVHTEGESHTLFLPVAEVLGESILHLVRNAVSHGIETVEERRRIGKSDIGRVQVRVTRGQNGGVMVGVTDDGDGIRAEGSNEQLLEKLTAPGFTTKETASEQSGRGVGLDVVRYNVERLLSGKVALEWNAPGEGCTFLLSIPNPGTVLGVLVVRAGNQRLAIPRVYVQSRRRIARDQLVTDNTGAYFYRFGSSYLRVFTPGEVRLDDWKERWAVILRLPTRRVALVVSECISEELVVRSRANRGEVYSKSLDQAVQIFLPLRFL